MSKKRKPRNIQQAPAPKAQKTRPGTLLLAWLLATATLAGGLAAIMTFWPRPSVSAGDPVDPDNPWSSAFTVLNGNSIPLEDVAVGIGPGVISGTFTYNGDGPLSERSGIVMLSRCKNH